MAYLVASSSLLLRGTLDQAVMQLGDRKRGDAAALLGGKGVRGQRSLASLFSALRSRVAAGGAPGGGANEGAFSSGASGSDGAQGGGGYQAPPRAPPPPPAAPRAEAAEPPSKRVCVDLT